MNSSSRLGLLRHSPSFRWLFIATAGSSFGTYLASIALTVTVYDETKSGEWVAALLIVNFLPIVVIGLALGPLLDRLSRRMLMIGSDLVRFAVFAALPFVDRPVVIVALAAVAGVATGFFVPASYAGLPNLVPDEELTNANSLLQTVETLAWMIGPVLGGLLLSVSGAAVPYTMNAVTFLFSAILVARIPRGSLQSEESLTRGHWRDVADGVRLVLSARPLRTVLIVWNIALLGSAAVNVAEVIYAKETLDAGNFGFGALLAGSGLGLTLGSYLTKPALEKVGLRRHYIGSIALMGVGWGGAALSPSIWLAVPFVVGGAAGNGAAVVSNRLFVQRGAPDRYRGRVLATLMSSTYAVLGIGMATAGVLTDVIGARAMWIAAAAMFFLSALVAVVLTRWLPVTAAAEQDAMSSSSESALAALTSRDVPDIVSTPARNGKKPKGIERIATLLDEIEARRAREAERR